jgi:hypothetical protein
MGGVDIYLALADVADLRRETTDFYFLDPVIFLFLVVNIGTIVLALRRIKARGAVPAGDAECPEGTVAPRSFEALGSIMASLRGKRRSSISSCGG